MSLDVTLYRTYHITYDNGKTLKPQEEELYSANITHNLGKMASEAGIYEALWRPYTLLIEYDIPEDDYKAEYAFEKAHPMQAKDIVDALELGLADLKARPNYFEAFNSPNGWGMYEHFVPFVEKYLNACKEYPEAMINVSR